MLEAVKIGTHEIDGSFSFVHIFRLFIGNNATPRVMTLFNVISSICCTKPEKATAG